MVQLHDVARDVRLEGAVIVWEIGERNGIRPNRRARRADASRPEADLGRRLRKPSCTQRAAHLSPPCPLVLPLGRAGLVWSSLSLPLRVLQVKSALAQISQKST